MRHQHMLIWISVLAIGLAGCGGGQSNTGGGGSQPSAIGGGAPISWERSPEHVVFQVDVVGGAQTFTSRNDVPLCTVYGDNRVVWSDSTRVGQNSVLFDIVPDQAIYDFVFDLSVNKRIYTYDSLANTQLTGDSSPVYEQIVLNVNNTPHITDGFEVWPGGYFREILGACQTISETPALFEPSAGWLSAGFTEYNPEATLITWDARASGIDLALLAQFEKRVWVDDQNVPILWNIMTNSPDGRLFDQNGLYFEIAFEVPNVHASSPPAPTADEVDAARQIDPDGIGFESTLDEDEALE